MKTISVFLAVALSVAPASAAEYSYKIERPEQERGANLILAGTALLIGAGVAGAQASKLHERQHDQQRTGDPNEKQTGTKAGKYSGATAVGMFAGILCLAVGFSIRF